MKVSILLLFLVIGVFSKLEFVSEISRHGARASSQIMNYTVDPEDNFKVPMELTNMGMRQHYLIGTHVRKHYIENHKLISGRYNYSEISFFSSDRTRTLESGESQIAGIFPPTECQQTLTDWQQKNAIPPVSIEDVDKIQKELKEKALPECFNMAPVASEMNEHSYDIQCQDSNCKSYHEVSSKLCASDEQADLKKPILDFLYPTFNEHIGEVTMEEVGEICSYLVLADLHKLELTFDWWKHKKDQPQEDGVENSDLFSDIINN
jgi:hypothetical protein